jgi:hypothetical protein
MMSEEEVNRWLSSELDVVRGGKGKVTIDHTDVVAEIRADTLRKVLGRSAIKHIWEE